MGAEYLRNAEFVSAILISFYRITHMSASIDFSSCIRLLYNLLTERARGKTVFQWVLMESLESLFSCLWGSYTFLQLEFNIIFLRQSPRGDFGLFFSQITNPAYISYSESACYLIYATG